MYCQVLTYGCESWILSEGDLKLLEAFQGEMAKRILKLPKPFSNTAAVTALDWPSMRARLLLRKLFFLKRVTEAQADTLVGGVVRAFSGELNHLCLVKECKDLEEKMGIESNLTDRILGELNDGVAIGVCMREVKDSVCVGGGWLKDVRQRPHWWQRWLVEPAGQRCGMPAWTWGSAAPEECRQW